MDWLRRSRGEDAWIRQWRTDWASAVEQPDAALAAALRARLDQAGAADDERFEIEREMLEGLEAAIELGATIAAHGPDTILTGHRAVGGDRCHFSAPASLPDDPAQPTGTLLLTSGRAIFVGGSRSLTVPWHAVGRAFPEHRDLVLIRIDQAAMHRFRCNSFTDALRATFLSRHLAKRRI